ncbi:FCS-Like Zinc finger 6 [Ziziphus jujuba]|uniref:FCS-Like Zinc finger 6 n=1 Tax=Ziziphus jujuba TaxID=326968 RepID=A0A6P4A3D1_ZIZJJ|nr:FCS-Like Zinc finger 6 [Ziziphus jujuba]
MSSKRSRIVRSSSQGEIGLFSQIQPIEPPAGPWVPKRPAFAKPVQEQSKNSVLSTTAVPESSREKYVENGNSIAVDGQKQQSILTLYSSADESNDSGFKKQKNQPNEEFGAFLKACSLCKKKLKVDDDLFMYGYLRAFCSPECRDDQIALDGYDREAALEYARRLEEWQETTNGKNPFDKGFAP